ncbi:MAG: hypothetical protein FD187_1759 [bacterium]|nr:MAG: hypothetical protein FD142_740 [bacterium]KAF0148713.1 MAG: hypothetical protein FD187_1759 [bacterium]KAF0168203.1 MAG: hypothetical protein FD158_1596 [bacterium]TXT18726.1 MAG: hypothetical protein FD132_2000 [bacterium]
MLATETLEFTDAHGACVARLRLFALDAAAKSADPPSLIRLDPAVARVQGEEAVQLIEGARYEYEFEDGRVRLDAADGEPGRLIEASRLAGRAHSGFLSPGLNTGRLALVARDEAGVSLGTAAVEVRSRKIGYRDDYRLMLEDITERCVDLLLELRAPTALRAAPDPGYTPRTIAQRFAFLKALLGSSSFQNALHRIASHPHQRWEPEETSFDTRRGFRPDARGLRQLARASRRVPLPVSHLLAAAIPSLPERISLYRNVQTEDTPENRFVKFALQGFSGFLAMMLQRLDTTGANDARLHHELAVLIGQLDGALNADVFRGVSPPDMLPLGSPVLQRKEGYREVYQAWLKFDMAARLVWQGGDDVYGAGQRDIATLYEYWVFFKLLDIVTGVFQLNRPAAAELMEETADGFGLKLKSGEQLGFEGITFAGARPLRARFSYNRSFTRNANRSAAGSWTERMRPDYTISLWPADFKADEAEAQELMVHVHFDAKYRIDSIEQLFGRDDAELDAATAVADLNEEKQEQKLGRYKRADLLKMHAYRDAIRRTQGAYVLYPGDVPQQWQGFHEILPGLGAFPIKPGNGDGVLTAFIQDVVTHTCDRATARERQSYHVYQVQEAPPPYAVLHKLPEKEIGSARRAAPLAETHVLIGWYKDKAHLEWVLKSGLYNFRMDIERGSLRLKPEVSGAQYLLLHSHKGATSPSLLRVSKEGPRVLSRDALKAKGYPGEPSRPFYLVYDVTPAEGFDGYEWDYRKWPDRLLNRASAEPQTITLDVLMAAAEGNLLVRVMG